MKVLERSYSTKTFRPKPHLVSEADGSLLVIATSWGLPEHAQMVADEVAKYVSAARGDVEVTSPFEFLTCLSDECNHLRISFLIANDLLYRGENKNEYVGGVELVAISRVGHQLSWAQVGAPHILLSREGRPLVPLATSFDHSFELGLMGQKPPPLPSRLLGVDPTCQIVCGDLQVNDNDHLILLSSSTLPQALWTSVNPFDLGSVTRQMTSDDPDHPFWVGQVSLSD